MTIHIPVWALYVGTFVGGWAVGVFHHWFHAETSN